MQSGNSYDDELNELSSKAESGDVEAGEKLLRLFATLADDPENAHPILVRHVARCVARLLEGEDPRSTFCIRRGRGAPPSKEVAAQREAIIHEYCRARAGEDGMKDLAARAHVMEVMSVSRSQVDEAYKATPKLTRDILIMHYTTKDKRKAGRSG